jgi:hypothetical protein
MHQVPGDTWDIRVSLRRLRHVLIATFCKTGVEGAGEQGDRLCIMPGHITAHRALEARQVRNVTHGRLAPADAIVHSGMIVRNWGGRWAC